MLIPSENDEINTTESNGSGIYTVSVDGQSYVVEVSEGGEISQVISSGKSSSQPTQVISGESEDINAPLAGNIFKVNVAVGDNIQEGDVIVILEAMKMETEVRATKAGTVTKVNVSEGNSVTVGEALIAIS